VARRHIFVKKKGTTLVREVVVVVKQGEVVVKQRSLRCRDVTHVLVLVPHTRRWTSIIIDLEYHNQCPRHVPLTSRSSVPSSIWSWPFNMPVIRRVQPADLFHLNLCNLDPYTENYDIGFYMHYLMKWPSLFQCIEEHGHIVGYIIGKVESSPPNMQ
jgi:hypothetical protein